MVESSPPAESSKPLQELAHSQGNPIARTARVLLLGRSGSGKSTFIETACPRRGQREGGAPVERTSDVAARRVTMNTQEFEFIDTPGFDNLTMTNYNAFAKLAKYLLHQTRVDIGITSIVYIHRASDPLESRALKQNLGVLFNVFLGDPGLSRLIIMVVPENSVTQAPADAGQALFGASVFRTAETKGARFVASPLCRANIDAILALYGSHDPILLRIQEEYIQNPQAALGDQIRAQLGYHEGSSCGKTIRLLETKLEEKESEVSELSRAHEQTEQRTLALSQQLQQTQKEYVSLRSQLQLHENVEQGEIVQTLKDLNRNIDDLARSISQYMVDTYSEAAFDKEASNVTTLDARHLPELKVLLGHAEGRSSLVASSDGKGMPLEDFLDYATRSLLCKHLCRKIFDRFHPAIDRSLDDALATMSDEVERESPAEAAKWRARSFKSLNKPENENTTQKHINQIVQAFVDESLGPLILDFFGRNTKIVMENQHFDRLVRLVRTAWEWNSTLKGEVIMLGNFYQTYYRFLHRFDPDLMEEFEPGPRSSPKYILGTLGLGLIVSQALGGGQPKGTVLLKASVATRRLYAV
ncbi:hypothetical protein FS749_016470 [Ceratobasidium sp. UAMH 11750]|nr:hypothetical protein FS749_016470 [Ceratobasidium sp. UAMH 11750]